MKIIIINGSPRTKGFTSGILREMEKSLEGKKWFSLFIIRLFLN